MRQHKSMIRKIRSVFQHTLFSAAIILCTLLVNGRAYAQAEVSVDDLTYEIKGVVRDANSKIPITAVQINTLNSSYSATSNENGEFVITIEDKTEVLNVVAFNYNAIEVPVQGDTVLTIELYSDAFAPMYSDVMSITGTQKSSYNTSSTRQIDDLGKKTALSADLAIQGQLGGDVRSMAQSGFTGAGNSMFIRGYNSLNKNAQPLIVVDGVIWSRINDVQSLHDGYTTNPLVDIAPSDIETVSIIKDGTSIWGSKGANGVILINTKHARNMATEIVVNATAGILQSPSSLPVMDHDQFRMYASEMLSTLSENQVYSIFGSDISGVSFLKDDKSLRSYAENHNESDWDKEVYKSGLYQDYDISVTGGDKIAFYAFSVGYSATDDVVSEVDLNRFNTRFNADIALYDNISLGVNVGFNSTNKRLVDDGVNAYSSPTYLASIKSPFFSPYNYSAVGEKTYALADVDVFGVSNPVGVIQDKYNTNRHYRFNFGLLPELTIGEHYVFSNKFDYN
nr:TonB-dependent receptor plug domain-containing protein [Bacteroidales bacterium]